MSFCSWVISATLVTIKWPHDALFANPDRTQRDSKSMATTFTLCAAIDAKCQIKNTGESHVYLTIYQSVLSRHFPYNYGLIYRRSLIKIVRLIVVEECFLGIVSRSIPGLNIDASHIVMRQYRARAFCVLVIEQ